MMSTFNVLAADPGGRVKRFKRRGSSPQSVARELIADGLTPVEITQEHSDSDTGSGRARYNRKVLEEFTATLALLLDARLTIRDALRVAGDVFGGNKAGELAAGINRKLERGFAFAEILDEMSRTFPPLYRGLVRIGERIGSLREVFDRLSTYLRTQRQVRDRAAQALTYPAIVLFVAVAGVAVVSLVAVPRLTAVFASLGPGIAEQLSGSVALFYWIVGSAVAIFAGLLAGACALWIARNRSASVAQRVDRLLLRLPVVGGVVTTSSMLNVAFSMETLVESGLPVKDALEDAGAALSNHAVAAELARAREAVAAGNSLSAALMRSSIIPRRVASWIAIGENTGDVGAVFSQLRGYYQAEQDRVFSRFMSLVEPALIIAVGVVILLIVILFVLPIFQALGSIL